MAPFDQEFHISLGVGVGGNADFADDSKTGNSKIPKPWENTSPKAELSFFMRVDEWHSTWTPRESGLIVDYVKVYSV
ncbi:beta-1,3-glucan-binding protein 1-like [Contarinia nasturtii]|uniref:beta-1,3-glucan-binding protein 1-like n=1 Tax=Contarinia nasturtii TaxID=265458 RepID=UPI0012D38C79|nr:beta-1,3-glucan-binding protein 1-like [Contarinia nasturtii]